MTVPCTIRETDLSIPGMLPYSMLMLLLRVPSAECRVLSRSSSALGTRHSALVSLHRVFEAELGAGLIEGADDRERFVQGHAGAFEFAGAKAAHRLGGFVV